MTTHIQPTSQKTASGSATELITFVIYPVIRQLEATITDIKYEPLYDEDQNYKLTIQTRFDNKYENISLFALKINKQWKKEDAAQGELKKKILAHLENKNNPNMLLLPSGAMIDITNFKESISLDNGLLKIENKLLIIYREGKFILLPAGRMGTYTSFHVKKTGSLLVISDEYDEVRKDGLEGFIFNLNQPVLQLKKEEISLDLLSYEEEKNLRLSDSDKYLIVFRKTADALNYKLLLYFERACAITSEKFYTAQNKLGGAKYTDMLQEMYYEKKVRKSAEFYPPHGNKDVGHNYTQRNFSEITEFLEVQKAKKRFKECVFKAIGAGIDREKIINKLNPRSDMPSKDFLKEKVIEWYKDYEYKALFPN